MGDLVTRVHEMAASFVKCRTREFLTNFLRDSGALDELYKSYAAHHPDDQHVLTKDKYLDQLVQNYSPLFGQVLGLSYGLGYADHLQGRTYQEIFVPKSLAD